MLKHLYLTATLYLVPFLIFAQVKSLPATKCNQVIKIDGNLDDNAWKNIEPVTGFINAQPVFGIPSKNRTEVKITYDNTAIYVGAYMYGDPAKIRKQLTARDLIDRQDVDYFVVGFDTYLDRQNAFIFKVSSANVQADVKLSQNSSSASGFLYDANWDAVWESKTSIKEDGWVAEIKIPLSAIRFPKKDLQDWGINFARFSRSLNETSVWSPINPNISGELPQWGTWVGLKNIKPPIRLSFLPYLSGGVRVSPTAGGEVTEQLRSGGMDLKYGINESFTLDMTLIPDFAQVQSDNVYLNLSPFEIKFDDYRPFFTEGTDLFNKAGIFYSRRIGASPDSSSAILNRYGNSPQYRIVKNPGITTLYNGTKFSGRTKGNLGIAVFNAVTKPMYARLENRHTGNDSVILTQPLTNYNIVVLDQALKNRSFISFTNTNVLRQGNKRNANVSSLDFSLFDKKSTYNVGLSGKYSSIWGRNIAKNGFSSNVSFGKVSGIFQFKGGVNLQSDKYDPNDLGFNLNNNSINYTANVSYIKLTPTRYFLNHNIKISFSNQYLYKPFTWSNLQLNASTMYLFKNFWDVNFSFESSPLWSKDYFVNSAVYTGRFLQRTPYYYLSTGGSSDSRKKLYINWQIGAAESPLPADPYWNSNLGVRYRFSNKLQVSTSYTLEQDRGNWGWAFINNPDGSPVIARRDVKKNTSLVTAQYSFTSRMNLSIRMRHYWSIINNTNFYNLKADGYWTERTFIAGQNVNFNTFNIDMFYTWDFLLGSRLTIAWKNALGSNVAINPYRYDRYFKNFGEVINSPHSNEITLKIVYFLDYLKLRRVRKA